MYRANGKRRVVVGVRFCGDGDVGHMSDCVKGWSRDVCIDVYIINRVDLIPGRLKHAFALLLIS